MVMDIQEFNRREAIAKALASRALRICEDFPKKGVSFADFNKAFAQAKTLKALVELFTAVYPKKDYSIVLAPEARGFILGPAIAVVAGGAFIPARKQGKLPNFDTLESFSYLTEYSEATIDVDSACFAEAICSNVNTLGLKSIVVYDDVLATGGTAQACLEAAKRHGLGAKFIFLYEISALKGREALLNAGVKETEIYSLIKV